MSTLDPFASISTTAAAIRRREISPVELTEALLSRISRHDPILNSYITVTEELARSQAKTAEQEILSGAYRGPMHGIPYSLKDLYYTKGIRTTAGAKIMADFVPDIDATVTIRLREAGAVLLGKNNMHEFAYGVTTLNPHFGTAHNAWDVDRTTGGSSGGSASAVAAGLASARWAPTRAARSVCPPPSSAWSGSSPRWAASPATVSSPSRGRSITSVP